LADGPPGFLTAQNLRCPSGSPKVIDATLQAIEDRGVQQIGPESHRPTFPFAKLKATSVMDLQQGNPFSGKNPPLTIEASSVSKRSQVGRPPWASIMAACPPNRGNDSTVRHMALKEANTTFARGALHDTVSQNGQEAASLVLNCVEVRYFV
jgi:hypothetical protein